MPVKVDILNLDFWSRAGLLALVCVDLCVWYILLNMYFGSIRDGKASEKRKAL